ncbi:unnamed protein product [Urochloa humidicola]
MFSILKAGLAVGATAHHGFLSAGAHGPIGSFIQPAPLLGHVFASTPTISHHPHSGCWLSNLLRNLILQVFLLKAITKHYSTVFLALELVKNNSSQMNLKLFLVRPVPSLLHQALHLHLHQNQLYP